MKRSKCPERVRTLLERYPGGLTPQELSALSGIGLRYIPQNVKSLEESGIRIIRKMNPDDGRRIIYQLDRKDQAWTFERESKGWV